MIVRLHNFVASPLAITLPSPSTSTSPSVSTSPSTFTSSPTTNPTSLFTISLNSDSGLLGPTPSFHLPSLLPLRLGLHTPTLLLLHLLLLPLPLDLQLRLVARSRHHHRSTCHRRMCRSIGCSDRLGGLYERGRVKVLGDGYSRDLVLIRVLLFFLCCTWSSFGITLDCLISASTKSPCPAGEAAKPHHRLRDQEDP